MPYRSRPLGRRALAGLLLAATAATCVIVAPRAAGAEVVNRPIAIVGDSLTVGSGPYIGGELDQLGITNRWSAQVGRRIPASLVAPYSGVLAVREMRAQGYDPGVWIIALGTNDIGSASGQTRNGVRTLVSEMRDELNSTGRKRIVWVNVWRNDLPAESRLFNEVLTEFAAADPAFTVVDYASWLLDGRTGYIANDGIHLTALGYQARARQILIDALRDYGTRFVGGDPLLHEPFTPSGSGAPLTYRPVAPERVLDTRESASRFAAGVVYSLDLSLVVPPDTEAVSLAISVDQAATPGFLTAFPCNAPLPDTSSLNFTDGRARTAHSLVGLDLAKRLCLRASTDTDVIIDLQGTFAAGAGGTTLQAGTPDRLADTRASGTTTRLVLAAPAGARAMALNVTATNTATAGYVSVHTCDQPGDRTAAVTFVAGETIGGAVFATVGSDGNVCVSTNTVADLVVDLTGVLVDSGGWRFVPAVPTRVLDTRDATGGWVGRTTPFSPFDVEVVPGGAAAGSGAIALVLPDVGAFSTLFPCGGAIPGTASVNTPAAGISANSFTNATAGGQLCVFANTPADVVIDTTGWWVP